MKYIVNAFFSFSKKKRKVQRDNKKKCMSFEIKLSKPVQQKLNTKKPGRKTKD